MITVFEQTISLNSIKSSLKSVLYLPVSLIPTVLVHYFFPLGHGNLT